MRGRGLASATRPLAEALLNLSRRKGSIERICERTYEVNDEALQATRDAMAEKPEKRGLDFDFNSGSTIDESTCCTGVVAAMFSCC